jgi:protein TonB
MTPLFALWLALLAPQATTTTTPINPPAAQPAQPAKPAAPAGPSIPSPSASPALRVGGGVTSPTILYQPEPEISISKDANNYLKKINGVTTVSLIVDTQGNPANVHISNSIADRADKKYRAVALSLDQAALDAVKQYKFAPATKDGNPVPVYLNIEVDFQDY